MHSTKSESLNKIDSNAKSKSYATIKRALSTGPQSRSQLASATGLKLSSICARCNELIKVGDVSVAGKTFDHETNRNVETLQLSSNYKAVAV